jgi:hypothetical protein
MRIAHAAIREKNSPYKIFMGKCHRDCFLKYHTMNPNVEDGFVTDEGNFVTCKTAALVAFLAGQVDNFEDSLYSEMLWSPQNNGKHDYNPETGYFLKTGEQK